MKAGIFFIVVVGVIALYLLSQKKYHEPGDHAESFVCSVGRCSQNASLMSDLNAGDSIADLEIPSTCATKWTVCWRRLWNWRRMLNIWNALVGVSMAPLPGQTKKPRETVITGLPLVLKGSRRTSLLLRLLIFEAIRCSFFLICIYRMIPSMWFIHARVEESEQYLVSFISTRPLPRISLLLSWSWYRGFLKKIQLPWNAVHFFAAFALSSGLLYFTYDVHLGRISRLNLTGGIWSSWILKDQEETVTGCRHLKQRLGHGRVNGWWSSAYLMDSAEFGKRSLNLAFPSVGTALKW